MKTVKLKYSWRLLHAADNTVLRDFGELLGEIDMQDDQLIQADNGNVTSESLPKLLLALRKSLAADVATRARNDEDLKEALHFQAWKPEVYKLSILGVETL
jgi:hypothetical protein